MSMETDRDRSTPKPPTAAPLRLCLATQNPHKVSELYALLTAMLPSLQGRLSLVSLAELGVHDDVVEDGETFADNARKKAEAAHRRTGLWSLADDSGLMVDALDGAPGVHSARYAGEPRSDARNLAALLEALRGVPTAQRTARAAGIGNVLLLVGAPTGRDGILGAAFASEALGSSEQNSQRRSHIQVGDPFAGKKLLEACLSFGPELGLLAAQDLGACGLACAAFEMAAASGAGLEIELDAVPLREPDLSGHEILLSESQERFAFLVRAEQVDGALAHFRRAGVHAAALGRSVAGGRVRVRHRGALRVDLPAELVSGGAPATDWPLAEALPPRVTLEREPAPSGDELAALLLRILAEPGVRDPAPIYDRYDQTVGNRTVCGPGQAAAAVLRLPGSARGFALTLTGRGDQQPSALAVDTGRRLIAGGELLGLLDLVLIALLAVDAEGGLEARPDSRGRRPVHGDAHLRFGLDAHGAGARPDTRHVGADGDQLLALGGRADRAVVDAPGHEQRLDARRAELNIHRARFFPDLALALRASYSWGPGVTDIRNPFIRDAANTQSLGAALVMQWELDFAGSLFRTRRAQAQVAQLEALDEQARDGIRLEVIATYEQLREADRREVAWARGERQTRSWFVAAGQAYQVGTIEPRELVDAMKSYFTARFNHLEALREFNTAAASLERVTGAQLVPPDAWEQRCTE